MLQWSNFMINGTKNTAKYHSPTTHLQPVSCILAPNGQGSGISTLVTEMKLHVPFFKNTNQMD